LRFGQIQQLRQQQRPHFQHRSADRMALIAKEIPKGDRKGAVGEIVKPDLCGPLHKGRMQFVIRRSGLGQTGQVPFDVGQEHRHPLGRKTLGQNLQRDRLARARGTRDQPVAVGVSDAEVLLFAILRPAAADKDILCHVCSPWSGAHLVRGEHTNLTFRRHSDFAGYEHVLMSGNPPC